MTLLNRTGVSGITYGAQWSGTMQSNDWHAVDDTGFHACRAA